MTPEPKVEQARQLLAQCRRVLVECRRKQLKRALRAEVEAAVEAAPTASPSEIVAALVQRHSKISGADGELALLCLQAGIERAVRKALKAKRKAANDA